MSFHGIIVYEIVENGRILKGIYTNTHLDNKYNVLNGIIKKKYVAEDGIIGTYSCRFMEDGNKSIAGELEIQKNNEVYDFSWKIEGNNRALLESFKGVGLMAGSNYLAVSYWYV